MVEWTDGVEAGMELSGSQKNVIRLTTFPENAANAKTAKKAPEMFNVWVKDTVVEAKLMQLITA